MNNKSHYFEIIGGNELNGKIVNQTSKNAILPIMSACLIAKGRTVLNSYPKITDVSNMINILRILGAKVVKTDNKVFIETTDVSKVFVDCKLSKTMRSSIFLLGSLLSRFKSACITMPGGCDIGKRPIDIHISALKKLGVKVSYVEDNIFFDAKNAKAGKVKLRLPSVGATENLIQFCSTLKGKTTIYNVAKEPEIVDLCNFMNKMGAKIIGAGTSKLTIYGVNRLNSTTYKPMGDRIVSGTIMIATAICGGNVTILNACPYENLNLIKKLSSMGCQINIKNDIINIVSKKDLISPKIIKTGFYPNFPTDLQSQMLVACCYAKGTTIIKEKIYENRFLVVGELKRMGADVKTISSNILKIGKENKLMGDNVYAKDLRGGAALVLAGLNAKGKTIVHNLKFIDRGYEHLETMLTSLGANIIRK